MLERRGDEFFWLEGENDEGEAETETELQTRWIVCSTCNGAGTTVFGWGANGDYAVHTQEDFDEDPDLAERLSSGFYDKPCPTCSGRTTVKDPIIPKNLEKAYNRYLEEEAYDREVRRAEMRYGC